MTASVDIVIPCYQYGRFLPDCVTSVLRQNVDALRILIIDNASTDDSVAVARRLAAPDGRIEVRARRKNLGPHASFNEGVDWAASDYVMILCADDLLAPGALERAVAVMEQNPDVSFAIGADREFRDGETLPAETGGDAPWHVVEGSQFVSERCRNPAGYVAAGAVLVRTSAQKAAGYYRPELPYTDDLEMLLRLAAPARVAVTGAVQGFRRLHGANMSDSIVTARVAELGHRQAAFASFFAREGRTMPEARQLEQTVHRRLAEHAYWWGIRDLARAHFRSAAQLFAYAFRTAPTMAVVPPVKYLFRKGRPLARLGALAMAAVAGRVHGTASSAATRAIGKRP